MKKHQLELYSAIAKAEKMSGFDSFDNAEGDMSAFDNEGSGFDGDEMSFFDGDQMSYAGGGQAVAVSDPYVIQYVNTVAVDATCYLMGFNDFFGAANYGNPATVTITTPNGGTYGRVIAQSNNKFFKVGKWRFESTTASQLTVTMRITHVDANGKEYITPMNLSVLKDAYQFQSTIIDVNKPVTFDGNTYIQFTLIASATLVISMYPIAVISGKARLNGGTSVNNAVAPKLSGKNASNVIIQTTQPVAGVRGRS